MARTPTTTLSITDEQIERLRDIAKRLGFTIGRGSQADWGSINQLCAAIADGEVELTRRVTVHAKKGE